MRPYSTLGKRMNSKLDDLSTIPQASTSCVTSRKYSVSMPQFLQISKIMNALIN